MDRSLFSKKAFSLVEVMVVVAIIAVLATITLPAYDRFVDKATMLEGKTKLTQLYLLEKTFFAEYGMYHENLFLIGYPNDATYTLEGHIENGGLIWNAPQTRDRYGVTAGFANIEAPAPPGAPINIPSDIAGCMGQSGCNDVGLGGYDGLIRSGSGCLYGSGVGMFQNSLAIAGLNNPPTTGPYATNSKFRGIAVGCSPSSARYRIFGIDDDKSLVQYR
jgi:prepilin-type N-terminal cleavage/methylation domain-containing protein